MRPPKCPSCETRRWAKRIRDDWFRCTNCGSFWESKGFSEQERLARFCPVCDKYVEYDNWHPYFTYGVFSYWEREVLKNFHYDCYEKYAIDVAEQQADFEREIARQEIIATLACPNCSKVGIATLPDGDYDAIYVCEYCDTEIAEEWINEKVKEAELENKR